jgi:hypothetical protein
MKKLSDPDPGSGMEIFFGSVSGIRDKKNPGSAILIGI